MRFIFELRTHGRDGCRVLWISIAKVVKFLHSQTSERVFGATSIHELADDKLEKKVLETAMREEWELKTATECLRL